MKSMTSRAAHYGNRMLSTLIDPAIASVAATAVLNYSAHVADFYPKQVHCRSILDGAATPVAQWAGFQAFNGKMYHFSKVTSGTALVAVATALVTQWSEGDRLGAGAAATLKKICLDVYAVTVP